MVCSGRKPPEKPFDILFLELARRRLGLEISRPDKNDAGHFPVYGRHKIKSAVKGQRDPVAFENEICRLHGAAGELKGF